MPLLRQDPPPAADAAIQAVLDQFADAPPARLNALDGTTPGELRLTIPHPVYTLGADDLAGSATLADARHTTWRYLLHQDGGPAVTAEATVGGADAPERFASFNQGPFAASTADAVSAAEALPEVQDRDYEMRMLIAPALHTMAVWLHGERDDLLLPLAPAPAGLTAGQRYAAEDYLGVLRGLARQVPAMDADDTRGS